MLIINLISQLKNENKICVLIVENKQLSVAHKDAKDQLAQLLSTINEFSFLYANFIKSMFAANIHQRRGSTNAIARLHIISQEIAGASAFMEVYEYISKTKKELSELRALVDRYKSQQINVTQKMSKLEQKCSTLESSVESLAKEKHKLNSILEKIQSFSQIYSSEVKLLLDVENTNTSNSNKEVIMHKIVDEVDLLFPIWQK